MTQSAKHLACDSTDWVTVAEAASLTNISLRHWQRKAVGLASRNLARLSLNPSGKGKPIWMINRAVDPKLTRYPNHETREQRVRKSLLERFPQHQVDRAYRKAYWLNLWHTRCTKPRSADQTDGSIAKQIIMDAKQNEGPDFKISVRSLQLWRSAYNQLAHDGQIRGIEGLVDGYVNTAKTTRDPEAIEYFTNLYFSRGQHSIRTCHDATVVKSKRSGWQWPASYGSTKRWVQKTIPIDQACLYREGPTKYSKNFLPHLEIDYTVFEPGERYVLDHTECDFWCRYQGSVIRPWLTTAIDARSRLLVGHKFTPVPHQDSIIACLRMAFKDRAIPTQVHIDQGKDFTSQLLTGFTKRERNRLKRELGPDWRSIVKHRMGVFFGGILTDLGIDIKQAIAYQAWAKALMERWYRTFQDGYSKTVITYCSNKPENRPESLKGILARSDEIPSFDECQDGVSNWLELYNRNDDWRGYHGIVGAGFEQLLALYATQGGDFLGGVPQ